MKPKQFLILVLVLSVFVAASVTYGGVDELLKEKIDYDLWGYIPSEFWDKVTSEAGECRLRIRVATVEGNRVARAIHWTAPSTWEITIGEVSTWEAVNTENLVHELNHAYGTDEGEVAARKAEAKSWKDTTHPKPGRGSGKDQGCWATYDMVYNKDGTQRSHDEIKKKLKTFFGYPQADM